MLPATHGQVMTAYREAGRRWLWRWPRVGRSYPCPLARGFLG